MSTMASQISRVSIVCSTSCSGVGQRKYLKLRVTGLCEGNSPVTGEFPAQRASNAENCFHLMTSSCFAEPVSLQSSPFPGGSDFIFLYTVNEQCLPRKNDFFNIEGHWYIIYIVCECVQPVLLSIHRLLPRIRKFIHTQQCNTTRGQRLSVVLRCLVWISSRICGNKQPVMNLSLAQTMFVTF